MIDVQNLTKRYGETIAVDDVSFTVTPGRVTGFLGPNGAGKSTTMRAMIGLDRPTAGRVLINGKRYDRFDQPLREVGAVLDTRSVHPGRTVSDHLLGLAHANRIPRRRVPALLDLVGLAGVADRRALGLSLGMVQRLGIAAALLGDPRVLLLDEPMNGLDPEGILWIRRLMRQLAGEGRTVLVSSHLLAEMALTADHLIVIGRGRLLADTSAQEFVTRHSRSYVRVRTPKPGHLRAALTAAGMIVGEGDYEILEVEGGTPEQVGECAFQHQLTVYEISPQMPTLEEAFVQLTTDSAQFRAKEAL
jgi:ABC-2 type transport system ATP-binding protein